MQFTVPLSTPNAVPVSVEEGIVLTSGGSPVCSTQDVTPPVGTTSLSFSAIVTSGTATMFSVTVVGDQSGTSYNTVAPGDQPTNKIITVPINTGLDQSYTIEWCNGSTGANTSTYTLSIGANLSSIGAGATNIAVTCDCSGGGGGGMTGYGVYTLAAPGSPATFDAMVDPDGYLGSDSMTFTPPADSIVTVSMQGQFSPIAGGPVQGFGSILGGLLGGANNTQTEYDATGAAEPVGPLAFSDLVDTTASSSFQVAYEDNFANSNVSGSLVVTVEPKPT